MTADEATRHAVSVTAAVNGKRQFESARLAQVAAAERLARAVVLAFDSCDDLGSPLSEVQRIAVIQAMLLEFDGFDAQVTSLESVGQILHALRLTGPSAARA